MTAITTNDPSRSCNDADELDELLHRMGPEILRFCRRRVGGGRAEEIHSDVQLAAIRATQAGKPITEGWLMTVARNKIVDHWRRQEREERLLETIKAACPIFAADVDSPATEVAVTLGKLRPRYRSVLERHYLRGEPVAEMAEADGVSYCAMESAMARARVAFRESHSV